MKKMISSFFFLLFTIFPFISAKNAGNAIKDWKLGVQMWTFHYFPFVTALDKVDSSGIKFIEAFPGQTLGGGMEGKFGISMSTEDKTKLKELLKSKGIRIVAMGVIVPKTIEDWRKYFDLAKEFGLSYITAEPLKNQWDQVDSLAGLYKIKVAIHDHPKPNVYWSPDSVLAATIGHPNLGSCADVGHWSRNGLNPVDCLKKLEGHIFGVHLKDIKEFNNTHAADTVVGKGINDFPAIFAELRRQGFKGMLSIEQESNWYNNVPDVISTRDFFEQQVAKLK
ncbi:MAG TPA: sugar phosphate isomerase/epimerase family protein [Puia sp.]|jgi:sugar phosphate isomerase/epimerase|nr:sugar phosphate isomerase/epimerase family protein [Puia sp.]